MSKTGSGQEYGVSWWLMVFGAPIARIHGHTCDIAGLLGEGSTIAGGGGRAFRHVQVTIVMLGRCIGK